MQINSEIIFTLARKYALPFLKLLQIAKESLCLNFGILQRILPKKKKTREDISERKRKFASLPRKKCPIKKYFPHTKNKILIITNSTLFLTL